MNESKRLQSVQSPVIPVVGHWIQECPGTISLGQGVVGYGPPESVWEAVRDARQDPDNHKYKLVDGIPPLLQVIETKLKEDNAIRLNSSCSLTVTAGGNMAFLNALLALADPGDEIILQSPFYFNHEMAVTMMSCRPIIVPTDARYHLQLDSIAEAITSRTKAIVTVSPNNPSGAVYSEAELRAVNALCADRGLCHIHDEAYEYFVHDDHRHFSPASIPGAEHHTISLFSLSKSYGFASWRIGYMVYPKPLTSSVRKIQDTNLICPPVVSQFAAVAAMQAGRSYCRGQMMPLQGIRRRVLEALSELGSNVELSAAEGAFYVLAKIRTDDDDLELVKRLIVEHRVAVIPGSAFGLKEGCFLRVAYGALAEAKVMEGIERLTLGLRKILR